MMFGAYFVIAVVIGHLATQLHEREQAERRREERATALYRLTRELAASRDLSQALPKVLQLIRDFFQADAAVWLRDENGLTQHPASSFCRRERTRASRCGPFKRSKPPENQQTRSQIQNACTFRWLPATVLRAC